MEKRAVRERTEGANKGREGQRNRGGKKVRKSQVLNIPEIVENEH